MINVTESAGNHLKSIQEDQGKNIMLGVRGGGCAGFAYDWQLMETEPENCEKIEWDGGKLYIDNMSLMYLFGSTVDLKKDVFGTVLEITSPAAQSSCGCGESVNFDMDYIDQHWDEAER